MATLFSRVNRSRWITRPRSSSMALAPGCSSAPFSTKRRIKSTLCAVTCSGNVSFLANTGGTPISLARMYGSGMITERAA